MGSILLVQSEPDGTRLAAAMREVGHEVLGARTAGEAFSRASEGGIDLIVLDAEPALATEFARSLQALPDPPPFVFLSSSPRAPELSARIGAAAFLPKPLEIAEIIAVVARHVEPRPVRTFDELGDDEVTGVARIV